MDFFEVVEKRRSIRRFKDLPFPDDIVKRSLEAALLAPNSSNTQTWDFDWFARTSKEWNPLVAACLSQSAARTAQHLIVVSADPKKWKRSQAELINWVKNANAPKVVLTYYEKLVPYMYRWGFLNSLAVIKSVGLWGVGLFRPIMRGPSFRNEIQTVAIKSAALAAENFVLAVTAQGGASCMMEGIDEVRIKKLIKVSGATKIAMVIGVGYEAERGTWGPRYRLPFDQVVKKHT